MNQIELNEYISFPYKESVVERD